MNVRIDLNEPKIYAKVTNDRFGKLVNHEWKRLLDPYTPEDTGLLMGRIGMSVDETVPFQLHYKATQASNSDKPSSANTKSYAAYVYFSNGLNFRKQGATDHWDIKAEQAGQKDKLYRELNNALRSGRY